MDCRSTEKIANNVDNQLFTQAKIEKQTQRHTPGL